MTGRTAALGDSSRQVLQGVGGRLHPHPPRGRGASDTQARLSDTRADGGVPAFCWPGAPRTLQPLQWVLLIECQPYAEQDRGIQLPCKGPWAAEWLPPSGSLPELAGSP